MGFDVIVVGAGMWGSACARHLAEMGAQVALVGPGEPRDVTHHNGVFGSHYDEARITRRLDSSVDWSRFATAAMGRYAEVEAQGRQRIFHRVGAMMAGPSVGAGHEFIQATEDVARQEGIAHERLSGSELAARFPIFSFPDQVVALFEESGGWINPRAHVAAEITAAQAQGATVVRDEVARVEETAGGVSVRCRGGQVLQGDKVVVACGAFSGADGLLPKPVPLTVYARTVAFLEIDSAEARRLRDMPSLVYVMPGGDRDTYVLPPVSYPDGKTYLKIGGDPEDIVLKEKATMQEWFRSGGDSKTGDYLTETLLTLMPDLSYRSVSFAACATSFTPKGTPLIYGQSDRMFAVTGGNGAGAKCADEIGRLGALAVLGRSLLDEPYETDFLP